MNNPVNPIRWQRRKAARPAEILEAALDTFFEMGFAAARLDDIAARAGVTKGTIYLYYRTKEEVFDSLVKAIPLANLERLEAEVADDDVPADVLVARFLDLFSRIAADERMGKFPRLVIGEAARFPRLADAYRREVVSRGVSLLARVIERGVREGVFRPVDAEHAAQAAITPLIFTAIWKSTFERHGMLPLDAATFARQHIDIQLRGLRADATG